MKIITRNKAFNLRLLISSLCGLAFAFTYSFVIMNIWELTPHKAYFTFIYLFILFTSLFYTFLYKYILFFLMSITENKKEILLWIVSLVLFGIFLVFAIPLNTHNYQVDQSLIIIANGDKNNNAQGHEVRIVGLYDGKNVVDLGEFQTVQGNWDKKDGQLIAFQTFPSIITWYGKISGNLHLDFITHPWSGIVQINWNNKKQIIDLYSSPGGIRQIELDSKSPNAIFTKWFMVVASFLNGISIGSIISVVILILSRIKIKKDITKQTSKLNKGWILYSIPMVSVWTVWLLAFWPGLMNEDSMSQWGQVVTGNFVDVFPAAHTISLWLITRLWHSPAAIAFSQILFLSIVVAWGLGVLRKQGLSTMVLWGLSLLFAISPVNSVSVITLWKDIPYATALLGLTIVMLEIVVSHGAALKKFYFVLILILFLLIIALFRFNGIPVAILFLATLFILFWQYWRRVFIIGVFVFLLFLIIRGPIYQMFKVTSAVTDLSDGLLTHHLAAYVKYFKNFTPEEKLILNQVSDMKSGWNYDCYLSNTTVFNSNYHIDVARRVRLDLYKIYFRTLMENPFIELAHTLCVSSIVWKVSIATDGYLYHTFLFYWNDGNQGIIHYILTNNYGIAESSYLPWLQIKMVHLIDKVSYEPNKSLVWSPGFYQYLAFLFVIIASVRVRQKNMWLILIPLLLQSGILMICNVAQDFRYQYGVYLIGLFSFGFLFLPTKKSIDHSQEESSIQQTGDIQV